MTTYVEVSEHNPAIDLLKLISSLRGELSNPRAEELVQENPDYEAIFQECFEAKREILGSEESVLSAIFDLQFQMLSQVQNSQLEQTTVLRLVDVLTEDSSRHCKAKIQLLSHLFNLVSDSSPTRPRVLHSLLLFALKSHSSALLQGRLSRMSDWVKAWNIHFREASELFLLASQVAEQAASPTDAQNFRIEYLKYFDGTDAETLIQSRQEACRAAVSAIKFADRCDSLLDRSSIRALSHSDADLFRLLEIFSAGCVLDFLQWEKQFPDSLQRLGISRESALAKLRTLTICSLGLSSEVIPFRILLRQLDVKDDLDVERLVVAAVRSGLLEARIDQQARTVTVSQTIQRDFNQSSWVELKQKLDVWKENTKNILILLRHVGRDAQEIADRN